MEPCSNGKIEAHAAPAVSVESSVFGRMPDGTIIEGYKLTNQDGVSVKLMSYGASVVELRLPDRLGKLTDVLLGFDSLEGYLGTHPFFGGTIGRYANRIAEGRFALDGKTYMLARNNGEHCLHGGKVGFDRRIWRAEALRSRQGAGVQFLYVSKDGEENFPGNVLVRVTFTLSAENEFRIQYTAETDKATPINLTNHSYFNLGGSGDVLKHTLLLNADHYTPVDASLIPTGEQRRVENTPFDFGMPVPIGMRIAELPSVTGYDHNYVVNGAAGTLRLAARVYEPASGRQMEVWTTEPGVQFYAGAQLDGSVIGKRGVAYAKYAGLCLETQHFPDSPNHAEFPSTILRPGSTFRSETVYKFAVK